MKHEDIAKVVDLSVCSTFTKLGFDMSDPTSIQKDIAHLRKSRKRCESIANKIIMTCIAVGVPAMFACAWWVVKAVVVQS